MEIIHLRTGKKIATKVKYANTFFSRLKGLMFVSDMGEIDALILDPCQSIHNFFVRFSLDVLFLNQKNEVIKIIRDFKPWRLTGHYHRSRKVVEMAAGTLLEDISVGDILEVRGV